MKYIIASDIHGSVYYTKRLLENFDKEGGDRLILLGDILYHGPRNDLPKEYYPMGVSKLLNEYKKKIVCIRGNCDSDVDTLVLEFPIVSDNLMIDLGDRLLFASHGHVFNKENLPPLMEGDILLNGHFHTPEVTKVNGIIYINPGSVSIPKNNSTYSYLVLENNKFTWKDMDGIEYMSYTIGE